MQTEEIIKLIEENVPGLSKEEKVKIVLSLGNSVHDPKEKHHRTLEKILHKTFNNLDKTDRPRIPTEVMHTYFTMYLDNERDERFILDVALQTYNKNKKEPFTKDNFNKDKNSRHGGKVGAILKQIEHHPKVVEMREGGVWSDSYFKKSRGFNEMLTYIKKTLDSWEKYKEVKEENARYKKHALETEIALINLKAAHKEITEPQRKQELIRVCKREGLTQVETSELIGVGIATVKRRWNT